MNSTYYLGPKPQTPQPLNPTPLKLFGWDAPHGLPPETALIAQFLGTCIGLTSSLLSAVWGLGFRVQGFEAWFPSILFKFRV